MLTCFIYDNGTTQPIRQGGDDTTLGYAVLGEYNGVVYYTRYATREPRATFAAIKCGHRPEPTK